MLLKIVSTSQLSYILNSKVPYFQGMHLKVGIWLYRVNTPLVTDVRLVAGTDDLFPHSKLIVNFFTHFRVIYS